ncbi:MAG TPA: hypothetical protein VK166_07755 [Chitinophagaceae bacterium]|nr:hypothetical protein [Chitinophagaceae bacterium]
MKNYGIAIIGAAALSLAFVSFRSPSGHRTARMEKMQTSWGRMGQGTIEQTENGVSTVNAMAGKPVYAIKIKVISGGVNLHKCEIWFNDGTRKEVELRNDVPAGSESREISLNDTLRQVSKIVFWYDTRNYKQRAQIELWGKSLS